MRLSLSKYLFLILCLLSVNTFAQKTQTKTASQVIDSYFQAIGGKEKALQINMFSSIAIGTLNSREIQLEKKLMLPNLYYSSMKSEDQILSASVFNGKKGKTTIGTSEQKMSRNETQKLKKTRSIFPEFNYYNTAKYRGIQKVGKEDCYVLEIENSRVFYSTITGLKVKGTSTQNKGNELFIQHLYFSNYVEIEGLLFPSRLVLEVGTSTIEFLTRSLSLNTDVTEKDFDL